MYPLDDTIAAIASPPGGAARGIVRISGARTLACLQGLFYAENDEDLLPDSPEAVSGSLRLPGLASPLPCDLYLWPDGRSYTGQLLAEIHTLGSPPLLETALSAICTRGARMAEPGEFTLRAFLAGRIDLTQAEAVLGVVDAADPRQLDVALTQLAGGLARPLCRLRDNLLELLAHLEAGLDFADEDLPFITPEQLEGQLGEARRLVAKLVEQMTSRSEGSHLIRAVLIGRPNAGKSSLFNALARNTGAIVSEHPRTTRDYLTAELDLEGVKCQLIDTAGMTTGAEEIAGPDVSHGPDEAARATAQRQTRQAHVQILCLDATDAAGNWQREQLLQAADAGRVIVLTKVDLSPSESGSPAIRTSAVTGEGIDALRRALRDAALAAGASGAEVVAGTAARCRESLRLAGENLDRAETLVRENLAEELIAAELRLALSELGKVVGAVYTDDVLDRIFSRFCIGK